ncbi:MAG: hypothetical protein QOK11_1696 [Pseudonocardiales bacterium]|nr:hypothetical protein [Pseudonocardiales bacterium]
MISGHVAVPTLIARYAELVDDGDFDALGELFANASITIDARDLHISGPAEISSAYSSWTRRYGGSGAPRTKHVTTNLILEVDDRTGTASCRSYVTVFQETPDQPIQPIYSGRYRDTFERAAGEWRFTSRHIVSDFTGDMSAHTR